MTMSILFKNCHPFVVQSRTLCGGSIKVHKNLQTKWCLINSTNVRPFSRLWMPRPDPIHSTDRTHCHSYLNFDSSVILNQQCWTEEKCIPFGLKPLASTAVCECFVQVIFGFCWKSVQQGDFGFRLFCNVNDQWRFDSPHYRSLSSRLSLNWVLRNAVCGTTKDHKSDIYVFANSNLMNVIFHDGWSSPPRRVVLPLKRIFLSDFCFISDQKNGKNLIPFQFCHIYGKKPSKVGWVAVQTKAYNRQHRRGQMPERVITKQ